MERILFSRLILAAILFCLTQNIIGQEVYYVFKKTGSPVKNTNTSLQRGSAFSIKDTLLMNEKDYVLFVNDDGLLFELNQPNKYAFSSIKDYKRNLEYDSFTKKYFTYVWKQFTRQIKVKQQAGVVYREERNIKLEFPVDSAKIFATEVPFSWNNKTGKKEVYFFLRGLENGHLTKIGLTRSGSSVTLPVDNYLLKPGKLYEWAVSADAFPNFNELQFNQLNILSKESHEELEKEISSIIVVFKLLGLKAHEIQEAICTYYKYCK